MKKIIRLTEGDLHRIVKESVNKILNETFSDGYKELLKNGGIESTDEKTAQLADIYPHRFSKDDIIAICDTEEEAWNLTNDKDGVYEPIKLGNGKWLVYRADEDYSDKVYNRKRGKSNDGAKEFVRLMKDKDGKYKWSPIYDKRGNDVNKDSYIRRRNSKENGFDFAPIGYDFKKHDYQDI